MQKIIQTTIMVTGIALAFSAATQNATAAMWLSAAMLIQLLIERTFHK